MSRPTKPCKWCGLSFEKDKRFDRKQWAARLYCSRSCFGKAKTARDNEQRRPLRELFDASFVRGEGCWNWNGSIEGYGYGYIGHSGKRYRAHVLALEYDGRPVPDGMVACHTCDNPRCVRPSHLYPGTPGQNVNDAVSRDRIAHGTRNWNAKLTPEAVAEMRKLSLPFAEIGRLFGVARITAARAIKGETWRRVR